MRCPINPHAAKWMSVCMLAVHVFPLTLAAISTAVCSTTPGMFLYRRLCCALLCPHVGLNGGHYWPNPRQVSVTCFQLRFLDVICFLKCQSLSGMIIYLFPSGSQPASVINQREVYMCVHVWWPMNGYILLGCSEEWLKLLHLGETTPALTVSQQHVSDGAASWDRSGFVLGSPDLGKRLYCGYCVQFSKLDSLNK